MNFRPVKAGEVLRNAATGRNYSEANLRGQSFKGKELSDADFSNADIRGANFTNATLKNANFTGAKAGLQEPWLIGHLLIVFLLSVLFNFLSMLFNGLFIIFFFAKNQIEQYSYFPGVLSIFIVGTIFFAIVYKGFTTEAASMITGAVAIAVITGAGAATAASGGGTALAAAVSGGAAVALAGAFAGGSAAAGAAIIAGAATAISGGGAAAIAGSTTTAIFVAIAANAGTPNAATAAVVAAMTVILNVYVILQTLKDNGRFALAWKIGVSLGAIGGTSFRGADLTDANFENAILENTNFNQTVLKRAFWKNAKSLDRARVGDNYLQNQQICTLVTTLQGQEQNFDRLSLPGINLQGANLQGASFISTDLNSANLQAADLSRAKLKQTQLDGTDLTGAIFTGAYIEDWGITGETKLGDVQCKYVYMHVPTIEDPDPIRKPDNKKEIFEDGDFADFIKPIVDTLDLYHNEGIDPRAIAIALKSVAEKNPDAELEWVATEKRGPNNLLLRFRTSKFSDKSKLSSEYFDEYNQLKALPSNELALLAASQGNYIRSLTSMITTALQQSRLTTVNVQGDFMADNSRKIINNSTMTATDGSIINQGDDNILTIRNLSVSSDPNQPSIIKCLAELKKAIEEDTKLLPGDKEDLLEQVKALEEAKQTSDPDKKESLVRRAKKIFEATLIVLPATATLVEVCNKLLPIITKQLGFPG
jgi:uncharacterized protein YjbI with pentapeptide repeats